MKFSWLPFVYGWVGGWVLTVLSFNAMMKIAAKDGEMRRETAILRTAWSSSDSRLKVAVGLMVTWPLMLVMWPCLLLFRFGMWLEQRSRKDKDPVRE